MGWRKRGVGDERDQACHVCTLLRRVQHIVAMKAHCHRVVCPLHAEGLARTWESNARSAFLQPVTLCFMLAMRELPLWCLAGCYIAIPSATCKS